jgi:cation transport ATPase
MSMRLSSFLLLAVLSVTDAYLLAHPNLIGRLGILLYKHSYIKTFPRALLTVVLVVGISVLVCEGLYRYVRHKNAALGYSLLMMVSVGWFLYVYITFSSFTYSITGKAFIYGAHLLPVILLGLYGRYFVKVRLGAVGDRSTIGRM